MVVEEAAEHSEPTTLMAAETTAGCFVHSELVDVSRCLIQIVLDGPNELR